MTAHNFVDCQGLAGAWTLGTVQAGFRLTHRVSQAAGFGDPVVRLNAHLLGDFITQADEPEDWWYQDGVSYVCGTPPCSGFSVYNTSKKENFRGADSPINSCMKELAAYGANCVGEDGGRGAEIIAFESVQGAFKSGRVLMQQLRRMAERVTGQEYGLTHVLMSGSTVGASQYRHRYYFVIHRVPFGIDQVEPHRVRTVRDAIGDLADSLERDWRSGDENRVAALVEHLCEAADWQQGEYCQDVVRRVGRTALVDEKFPNRWNDAEGSLRGLPRHWPKRLRWDAPSWVVTGNSSTSFVHPDRPRVLGIQELARLMGYPDEWEWPESSIDARSSLIGKCCPVESGRWVSEWAKRALDGEPGAPGDEIGDREYLVNNTLDYRRWDSDVSGWSQDLGRRPAVPGDDGKVG